MDLFFHCCFNNPAWMTVLCRNGKSSLVVCCFKHVVNHVAMKVNSSSTVRLASVSWNCYCAKATSAVSQSVTLSLSLSLFRGLPTPPRPSAHCRLFTVAWVSSLSHERPPPLPLHPSVRCQVTRLFVQMEMERKWNECSEPGLTLC